MTLVLAIETATDYGSVAVGEPGKVVAEVEFHRRQHASGLMPSIVEALGIAGCGFGDLSGVIVADGPGSFTGLRIGASTAKGMLLELRSIEMYTAPSLLGLAYGASRLGGRTVAALYDALRGEVYGAVYRFERERVKCELEPDVGTIEDLRRRCAAKPAVVVGDGALQYRDSARDWAGADPLGPPELVPKASALLGLFAMDGAVRRVDDPTQFEPQYGRAFLCSKTRIFG